MSWLLEEATQLVDSVDARVLTALSRSPVGNTKSLADASGLSKAGLARRLRRLGEAGILYPGYARAQVSYPALGLEVSIVLAEVPGAQGKRFEKACDFHPYTQFRIRCTEPMRGSNFIATFATPLGSRHKLLSFLESLVEGGVLASYSATVPIAMPERQEFDFTLHDQASNDWVIDWRRWGSSMGGLSAALSDLPPPALHLLDSKDIRILRLLSMDAREEKWKLAEKAGVRDYDLSRRLAVYEAHRLIDGYRVVLARNIAGFASTVAVRVRASLSDTARVFGAVRTLPFQGIAYPIEGGLLYIGNLPPGAVPKFTRALAANCEGLELAQCDYSSSMRYLFDNEPSNYVDGSGWRRDTEYMVSSPLAELERLGKLMPGGR